MCDGKEAFFQDRKAHDAVIRNPEGIGQAVKDIGVGELAKQPVWNIVERDLPALEEKVGALARAQGISLD